jgi:hypothetical protein
MYLLNNPQSQKWIFNTHGYNSIFVVTLYFDFTGFARSEFFMAVTLKITVLLDLRPYILVAGSSSLYDVSSKKSAIFLSVLII